MALGTKIKAWWCAWAAAAVWWGGVAADGDVTLRDRPYAEETLASGVYLTRGLAVDYTKRNVYFSFYNGSRYSSAKVNLRSKNLTIIEELSGPCWYAVDQERGQVHAGCSTNHGGPGGLHQWDDKTGRFEPVGETRRDVRFVHYSKDKLYYSVYPESRLLTFANGSGARVSALAMNVFDLVVDAHAQFIFTNGDGVYRWPGHGERETRYEDFDIWVEALAVDGSGAAYACETYTQRGVWRLDRRAPSASRLLDVNCTSLTFDADGSIIYADLTRRSVVRLVPAASARPAAARR